MSVNWRSDELDTRCGRESHHPAEGAFGTPDWVWRPVGEKMLEWEHVPERLVPQAPDWAVQENENDTRRCPEGLGRSICCSHCSVSNSLSHANLTIKWKVFFFKEVFARLSSLCSCVYACTCVYWHIYIMWLYNTQPGCDERSVFKQRKAGLNLMFTFSKMGCFS